MDAQSGITGKVHGKDVIIVLIFQRKAKHPVKLGNAPSPVFLAEDPALEFDTEFAVVRKPVFWVRHLVMEKANGGEVCFNGTGRLVLLLQILHITHQVLAADILQLLQPIFLCKIAAETFDRFIIAVLCPEAALPVVPCQLVQLSDKRAINALVICLLQIVSS